MRASTILAALALFACRNEAAPPPAATQGSALALQWYRVEIDAGEEGRIPFFLAVSPNEPRAYIDCGPERLEVPIVQRDPLVIRVPVRGTNVELRADGRGGFTGTWQASYLFKKDFPLSAQTVSSPAAALLFPGSGAPATNISGEWRVDFDDLGAGRAVFHQQPDGAMWGTIWPSDLGDQRYLRGRMWNDHFALSTFDGARAIVVSGDVDAAGTVRGHWMFAGIGTFTFTAKRGNLPSLDELTTVRMRKGATRLSLPALSTPPYRNNPVIIDYFGTWCSNCIDLMPELVRLHRKYADDGLQILSIALEPGDRAPAERRLAELRQQYGMTWPIELRLTEDYGAELPAELENANGFPLTIFIRRDGTVAGVHTAFIGPAAGSAHEVLVKQFETWTQDIVRR